MNFWNIPSIAFATIFNFLSIFLEKSKFYFSPKFDFLDIFGFLGKSKNARAEILRKTHRRMPRDLSYETDSGPKTKTENQPFSGPLKKLNNFSRLPKRNWVLIGLDFQNMCCNDLHQTGHELAFDESKKAVGQNYKTS